jgi:hypothetical protein
VPHPHRRAIAADQLDGWSVLAVEGQEIAGGLATSPLALPGFFIGWVGLGVLVGLGLARRGHDRRTLAALGAGLGPLMIAAIPEAVRRRERETRELVVAPGIDHGGHLDILVLVQEDPAHVHSVVPTLAAVKRDVGTLTIARVVDYDWLDGSDATRSHGNEVIATATSALVEARELVPISRPALVVLPGTVNGAARAFSARARPSLVLVAIDESSVPPVRW